MTATMIALWNNKIINIMNSHVQIPKSILRNFAYKSKKDGYVVDYLDLHNNSIKTERIKKLDTIENYYSKDCEDFLSTTIEGPFGEISKKIREFGKGKIDPLTLSEREKHAILDFFNFTLKRSKIALEEANKASLTSAISPITQEEILMLSRARFFKEYFVNIIVNRTEIDFVIPRNCFYDKKAKSPEKRHYILPFAHKVAIILLPNEESKDYDSENKHRDYFYIDNENIMKKLNEFALHTEVGTNNEFVVGNINELNRLKEINLRFA
ncbi:MAG: DUF4238 domain-containing protein [Candidatus Marinimicrobia bacterium]|nr:DUF4238 domain-containing protein [Candidatus Neomarinimicrobiota bacterium]